MSHLHIHIPHKHPSIEKELNSFLQLEITTTQNIEDILTKICSYLSFFIESFSTILNQAKKSIKKNKPTDAILLLEQSLDQITFHSKLILEKYKTNYLDYYDALKCFPLCELVIREIIFFNLKLHKNIV